MEKSTTEYIVVQSSVLTYRPLHTGYADIVSLTQSLTEPGITSVASAWQLLSAIVATSPHKTAFEAIYTGL